MATIILTGTYEDGAGNPLSGTVTFTPVSTGTDGTVLFLADPITAKVVGGVLSKSLVTTDSYTADGAITYRTVEKIGTSRRRFYIALPSSLGATVNIADLIHFGDPPNQIQIDTGEPVDLSTHIATDHAPITAELLDHEDRIDDLEAATLPDFYVKPVDGIPQTDFAAAVNTKINTAIQGTIIDAKGDIITSTAADTPIRLAVGSNNQVLIADSTQATGLRWGTTPTAIAASIVDVKGDLIAATANDAVARLGVGTNGQVLTADSTQTSGLIWATPSVSTAIPPSIVDVKGDIIAATAADTVARLAAGTNGQMLTAQSAQTTGLQWATPTFPTIADAKGDIFAGTGADTVARLAVGANDTILIADSAQTTGVKWGAVPTDATKANVSGSIRQFADVSDTSPADGDILVYDSASGYYVPTDMSALFAPLGPDGRIISSTWPEYFVPMKVINEGDSTVGVPSQTVVLSRVATGTSLVPSAIGSHGNAAAGTTCAFTTTDAIAVNEWIIIGVYASGEATLPMTYSVTYGTGATSGGTTSVISNFQTGTIQADLLIGKVTTLIPSGTTVTVTSSASRSQLAVSGAKVAALNATPVDVTWTGGGGSGSGGGASPYTDAMGTSAITTVANELALVTFGFNPGTAGTQRTLAGLGGWSAVGPQINGQNSGATTFRGGQLFFKVLSATATQTASVQVTSTGDGSNSAWTAGGVTLKGP